jgi:hypothetical protein
MKLAGKEKWLERAAEVVTEHAETAAEKRELGPPL